MSQKRQQLQATGWIKTKKKKIETNKENNV